MGGYPDIMNNTSIIQKLHSVDSWSIKEKPRFYSLITTEHERYPKPVHQYSPFHVMENIMLNKSKNSRSKRDLKERKTLTLYNVTVIRSLKTNYSISP